jgi:hypothetical protein
MTHIRHGEATDYGHAIDRAWERHRVELTCADLNAMVGMIEAGKSVLQGTVEAGLQRHMVLWKGKALPVLFSPLERHIVTVLKHFRMREPRRS